MFLTCKIVSPHHFENENYPKCRHLKPKSAFLINKLTTPYKSKARFFFLTMVFSRREMIRTDKNRNVVLSSAETSILKCKFKIKKYLEVCDPVIVIGNLMLLRCFSTINSSK